jgi:hypothetical protein
MLNKYALNKILDTFYCFSLLTIIPLNVYVHTRMHVCMYLYLIFCGGSETIHYVFEI